MLPTTDNEKTSLEAHVDLCALRYQDLDTRLTKLEAKLDIIDTKLDTFKHEIAWMLIKGGASTILLLLTALGTTLKLLGHF
jgi:hypothetical protein